MLGWPSCALLLPAAGKTGVPAEPPKASQGVQVSSLGHGEASEVCRCQAARLDTVKQRASGGRTEAARPGRQG